MGARRRALGGPAGGGGPALRPQEAVLITAASALREIQSQLRSHTDTRDERRLLGLLEGLDDADLDAVIGALDLGRLLSALDDRWMGPQHHSRLLELLTVERLHALSAPTRAALVQALQAGHTGPADERAIRDVLLGTRGADLVQLKHLLHGRQVGADLVTLLRHDLDDAHLVAEILAHFRAEAEAMGSGALIVLSDIDDTIVCQLHDDRYPRGTVYPGVLALHQALVGAGPDRPPGALTLVTARPGDRLGVLEGRTVSEVQRYGVGAVSLLTGDLPDLVSHTDMARGKLENIQLYRDIFPESPFVWVGDNGQGDAILGGWLMAEPALGVLGAVIHDVTGADEAERVALREKGVRLFRTYAGAAALLFELKLLDAERLCAVADAAVADLVALELDGETRAAREAELAVDLAVIRAMTGG